MKKKMFSRELALLIAMLINSFSINMLIKSNFGLSSLSSMPYIFSKVLPQLTLGMWTIIVQLTVLLVMMLIVKKIKIGYLFSFLVSIGVGVFIDLWAIILSPLPLTMTFRLIYFTIGFFGICLGVTFYVLCGLPVQPFDLFVREVSHSLNITLKKTKTIFDLVSITISSSISLIVLHRLDGIGIGTIIGALFTGIFLNIFSDVLKTNFEFEALTPVGVFLHRIS